MKKIFKILIISLSILLVCGAVSMLSRIGNIGTTKPKVYDIVNYQIDISNFNKLNICEGRPVNVDVTNGEMGETYTFTTNEIFIPFDKPATDIIIVVSVTGYDAQQIDLSVVDNGGVLHINTTNNNDEYYRAIEISRVVNLKIPAISVTDLNETQVDLDFRCGDDIYTSLYYYSYQEADTAHVQSIKFDNKEVYHRRSLMSYDSATDFTPYHTIIVYGDINQYAYSLLIKYSDLENYVVMGTSN